MEVGSFWGRTAAALLALHAVAQPLAYQPSYRAVALQGLRALYAMDFYSAERHFVRLDSLFGPYVGTAYLRALAYSWRIELDPSTTWFDSFWERELSRTDSLLRCCSPGPLERYFIGFGNRALLVRRLYVRGDILGSLWKARDLLPLLEGMRTYADSFPELGFALGLYEYYIGYFSRNYPIMRPILRLFPPGDEARGLARLEQCARDSLNYTRFEAQYFLGYIYLYQAKRPKEAEAWLRQLSERFPANPLFRRMWAEALYENKRYAEARAQVSDWLAAYEQSCSKPPCYLIWSRYPSSEAVQAYGLLGMALREEKQYAEALAAFARMDTLLGKLRSFPAPTWARLMREAALLEKRMGESRAAEARLARLRRRDDVPAYLKGPLPD